MEEALNDIFGPLFETMLKAKMNHHLGYESNFKNSKAKNNRTNGYGTKKVKTNYGEIDIDVSKDRDASFEPELIKKRQTDISSIENKVLAMYDCAMYQRDIFKTVEDIFLCLWTV